MNSSHQDKSASNTIYISNAVIAFFNLFGKSESAKKEAVIFAQGQKPTFFFLQPDKMYLLVEGEIIIQAHSGEAITIEPNELFGEFTPHSSRTVTAIASMPCKLMTLSEKQILTGLKKKPEFLFMLMEILVNYLRNTDKKIKKISAIPENKNNKNDSILPPKMLQELVKKLGVDAVMNVPEKRVIFQEGAAALLMYVILEGNMITIVGDQVVRRSGAGDIVGEIALVDQKPRTASVVAETRCSLLAINRQTLLDLVQTLPAFGIALLRILASRSRLQRNTEDRVYTDAIIDYSYKPNQSGIEIEEID